MVTRATDFQLAQLNIARALAPMDDPLMAEFVARLDEVNALADSSPGFVWRLQDESGNATSIQAFDDPRLLANMSVWESLEALFSYVYRSDHTKVLARRREWFEMPNGPQLVLWWVPSGHRPDLAEAKSRLERLTRDGPTADAFTFKKHFPPPTGQTGAAA
jgi:hypothetical protein